MPTPVADGVPVQVALARIIGALPGIGKGSQATEQQGGYKYRGIEQITAAVGPLLAEHGVVLIPRARVVSIAQAVGMREMWTDTVLEVTWTIVGPDGSSLEAVTVGVGRDGSDKGANKAMTQAYKYLLLDVLCVADKSEDSDGNDYRDGHAPPKTESQLLFDRLTTAGPEMQGRLRAQAEAAGRRLTVPEFDTYPAWRDEIQTLLASVT